MPAQKEWRRREYAGLVEYVVEGGSKCIVALPELRHLVGDEVQRFVDSLPVGAKVRIVVETEETVERRP